MIPIGPIIWLVARGLQQKNRGGGAPAKPIEVKPFVIVWVLAVLVELGVDALYGTTGTIVFFCLASPFLFPWSVTRLVFIPLGWGHPALHLSKLAGLVENAKSAGPAFAAAAALSRSHRHDERLAERIVKMATRTDADVGKLGLRHYPAQPASMNAAAVAALGFVAASRGDRDRARLLLRTALDFPRSRTPAAITRLCLDWLAAEAYDRRDYGAVIDLESANPTRLRRAGHRFLALGANLLRKKLPPPAVQTEAGCGSQVRFLAAAARRRAEGAEQISNAELILRWART